MKITIKQLRQIAKVELLKESADLTSDALADSLADGFKKQLSGEFAVKIVNEFFANGQKPGMMFPAKQEDIESLKSQVAQKVMTRLGQELQNFVESLVARALKSEGSDAPTNESVMRPTDYSACKKCGLDHEYDYVKAISWHEKNDD